jgi:hypothetical protein
MLVCAGAYAASTVVPKGTPVTLVFDQRLSSKTAKAGQTVRMHVRDNVVVDGRTVLARGTPVRGVISQVDKRKRYGVNAKLRIAVNPVRTPSGARLTLEPRNQGAYVAGKKSSQAAAATAGGAMVLGPVGLVGGMFIHGKSVEVKPGDTFDTSVARDTVVRR